MTVYINGTTGYSGPVGTIGDLTTTGNTTLGDASGDTLTINGSTTTLTQGTANGVAYLNASKVLTTGTALVFDGTNLGIGTTSPASGSGGGLTLGTAASGKSLHVYSSSYASNGLANFYGTDGSMKLQLGALSSTSAYIFANTGCSLVFYSGGNTSATLDSSGNLLVGTTTSSAKLTINGNGYFAGTSGTGGRFIGFSNGTPSVDCYVGNYQAIMGSGSSDYALIYSTNRVYALALSGGVYVTTNGTSWTSASDERMKDIIEPISNAANKVSSLRAVIGKYKTDEDGTRRSFLIAQDVQAVLPEAVDASNPDELGVQYTEVIPLLVAAIKEQQAIITQLQADVETLKGQA